MGADTRKPELRKSKHTLMASHKKFPALGRGLDALISTEEEVHTSGSSSISEVPVFKIKANPNQPRREFSPEALQELADSIRQIGIIQPITLRLMEDGSYQIIAGERRWRASQMAGLTTIPAYIRTADDENMMQMALVENIQREDLNAIEIALAAGTRTHIARDGLYLRRSVGRAAGAAAARHNLVVGDVVSHIKDFVRRQPRSQEPLLKGVYLHRRTHIHVAYAQASVACPYGLAPAAGDDGYL